MPLGDSEMMLYGVKWCRRVETIPCNLNKCKWVWFSY